MKLKKLIGLLSTKAMINSAEAASKSPWLENSKNRSLKVHFKHSRFPWRVHVNWRWREDECDYHPAVPNRVNAHIPKKCISSQGGNTTDYRKPVNLMR